MPAALLVNPLSWSASFGASRAGLAAGASMLEPLEPRTLLSFSPLGTDDGDLAAFGVTTTGSAEVVDISAPTVDLSAAWTGQSNARLIGLDRFRSDPRFQGYDGRGYSVAIIDTGINLASSFFGPDADRNGRADRIVAAVNFSSGVTGADRDGHGSNVASAAASSNATYPGVAPGANIVALNVTNSSGSILASNVELALQWVLRNASTYNIVAVNMSLGDPTVNSNSPVITSRWGISDELAQLTTRGIIPVAAAGNSYGTYQREGVSYPAADRNAIAVGAVYSANVGRISYASGVRADVTEADLITPFSQRATGVATVFAPGAPVVGAAASGQGTVSMHGTSQAAPQVTGMVAIAQQLAQATLGRRLTFYEFRTLLSSTGRWITDGDDEVDSVVNTGKQFRRVDMLSLAEGILQLAGSSGPPVQSPTPAPPPEPPPPSNTAPALRSTTPAWPVRSGVTSRITFAGLTSLLGVTDAENDSFTLRISSILNARVLKNGQSAASVAAARTLQPGEAWDVTPTATSPTGTISLLSGVVVDRHGAESRSFVLTGTLTNGGVRSLSLDWASADEAPVPLAAVPSIAEQPAARVASAAGLDFDLSALMHGRRSGSLLDSRA